MANSDASPDKTIVDSDLEDDPVFVVTGAFGFTGQAVAQALLAEGKRVRTLTNSPARPEPLASQLDIRPLDFHDHEGLVDALRGAVLFNTYWVRYNRGAATHQEAVANSLRLFSAAKVAGVRRVVHVSITHPSLDSKLSYYRGKAEVEQGLEKSGLSYAIVRPAILFGPGAVLFNNIAWMLRKMPLFGLFGDGDYRLQPIHVDDLAHLMLAQVKVPNNVTIDAVGPETFTLRELCQAIGDAIGHPRRLVRIPGWRDCVLGRMAGWLLGKAVGDVVLTGDEVRSLMGGLLATSSPATGPTRFSEWLKQHGSTLGLSYARDVARRR
jgi:NADH dehydrogenase